MADTDTDISAEDMATDAVAAPAGVDESIVDISLALEAIYDIPVEITVVLGSSAINVQDLLSLDSGSVVELNRKVGESVDIYVNSRLVAKGEVVIVDDNIGITMTEVFKMDHG